jgi:GNAT superfamily N-acetyltransferase
VSGGCNSDAPGPLGPGSPPAPGPQRTSHTRFVIRQFAADEWQEYRRLRLSALADSPDAFGSTLAAEQALPDALWEERLRAGVDSADDCPLLALADDEAAGLVWGKIDPVHPSVAHTYQMWVAPTHRHLGIGGAILEALIVWARSRNAKQVVLSVTCGDSPARRLYDRVGFLPAGNPKPLRTGATLMAQEMELNLVGP